MVIGAQEDSKGAKGKTAVMIFFAPPGAFPANGDAVP
jgi:hypothetical protein